MIIAHASTLFTAQGRRLLQTFICCCCVVRRCQRNLKGNQWREEISLAVRGEETISPRALVNNKWKSEETSGGSSRPPGAPQFYKAASLWCKEKTAGTEDKHCCGSLSLAFECAFYCNTPSKIPLSSSCLVKINMLLSDRSVRPHSRMSNCFYSSVFLSQHSLCSFMS